MKFQQAPEALAVFENRSSGYNKSTDMGLNRKNINVGTLRDPGSSDKAYNDSRESTTGPSTCTKTVNKKVPKQLASLEDDVAPHQRGFRNQKQKPLPLAYQRQFTDYHQDVDLTVLPFEPCLPFSFDNDL